MNNIYYIYVLELVRGKYYVGKTRVPKSRLLKHAKRKGACWTKKYKVLNLLEMFEEESSLDEDFHTLKTMKKYGVENVRGGSFCRMVLKKEELTVIERIIRSSNDECFKCKSSDHFLSHCPQKVKVIKKKEPCNEITVSQNINITSCSREDLIIIILICIIFILYSR